MKSVNPFVIDMNLLVPVLVDTGAGLSIIPKKLCKNPKPIKKFPVKGVTGNSLQLAWTAELTLDIGFDDNSTHKFYVADIDQDYIIMGLDYMIPRGLFPVPHRNLLVEEKTGRSVQMVACSNNNFSTDEIWDKFLSTPAAGTSSKNDPTISTVQLCEAPNEIGEKKCWEMLYSYPRLTSEEEYFSPARHGHALDMELVDTSPLFQRPRRCNVEKQRIIDDNFHSAVKNGSAITGSSSWVSPVTIVKKKDGSPRICVDYVKLNARTIPIHYPIPLIQSLPTRLSSSSRYFSTLDMRSAYLALPLTERASKYAAITTVNGNYLPLRTTFGLRNAPAKFCELVAEMISGLEHCVYAYMDDFLVFSNTLEDHYQHLDALLKRLDDYGMFVNEKKCHFAKNSVYFLGHTITSRGLQPLSDKVAAISNLLPPTNLTELRRFLGSLNYYRNFLPGIAETLAPLTNFLRGEKKPKKTKIKWEDTHQKAFDTAINKLKEATCLAYEDPYLPLILSTDASSFHAGAVLEQASSEDAKDVRPLAFFSKAFPLPVASRSTFHRELTAMFFAFKHFKHRLRGRPVTVQTDHASLVNAINNGWGEHSPKESGMIEYIKEFSPTIVYIAGEENQVADFLSRPVLPIFHQVDDESMTAPPLADQTYSVNIISHPESTCLITPELIAVQQFEDPEIVAEVAELTKKPNATIRLEDRPVPGENLRLFGVTSQDSENFRPILPETLRALAFHNYHDVIHQGQQKSVDLISSKYYWPGLSADITSWVKACPQCQSCKVSRHNRQALQNFPDDPGRFKVIHADLVGPLEESVGWRYILTIRDRGTGFLISAPLPDKTATSVVDAFSLHYIAKFGVPQIIISDNGGEFIAHAFGDFCERLGIHHKTSTAYHPQAQGAIERIHRPMKTAFRALSDTSSWPAHLPFITLALNNLPCDNNIFTPHQMAFGQAANLPGSISLPEEQVGQLPSIAGILAFIECMGQHKKTARPLPENSPHIEKDLFTCRTVWIFNNAKKSLEPLYTGPYLVLQRHHKYFTVLTERGAVEVSVDRLKTAYELPSTGVENDDHNPDDTDSAGEDASLSVRPPRNTRLPAHFDDYILY